MIEVSNVRRIEGMDFQVYRNEPGFSFSFLKREKFGVTQQMEATHAMKVGSIVDAIITEPESVNMNDPLYDYGRTIAFHIKSQLPAETLKKLKKQVSFFANFHFKNFTMPVKGRLDFEIPSLLTLDLKVTGSKNLDAIINYMGYEDQVWGYSKMAGNPMAIIMGYLRPTKQVQLRNIPLPERNEFWEEKIIKFGTV